MKKRYWLRGAFLGVLVSVTLTLAYFGVASIRGEHGTSQYGYAKYPVLLDAIGYGLYPIPLSKKNSGGHGFSPEPYINGLIEWIIIGAMVGFIYGKFKMKDTVDQKNIGGF